MVLPHAFTASIPAIFMYISPDQLLPITSVLGGIIGFLLLLGHRVLAFLRRGLSFFNRRPASPAPARRGNGGAPRSVAPR